MLTATKREKEDFSVENVFLLSSFQVGSINKIEIEYFYQYCAYAGYSGTCPLYGGTVDT